MEPQYEQNRVDIYQEYPMSSHYPQTTTTSGSINISAPWINTTTTPGTWITTNPPFVPPVDPGPSNEEVDEAIRSIRRTIEKHSGE